MCPIEWPGGDYKKGHQGVLAVEVEEEGKLVQDEFGRAAGVVSALVLAETKFEVIHCLLYFFAGRVKLPV